MTESLTIKDLNCSTCPKDNTWECPALPYNKFLVQFIGCCYHPLALQVLAAPLIAELEKIRQRNDIRGNCRNLNFHDGVAHGCESAITLLKGAQ